MSAYLLIRRMRAEAALSGGSGGVTFWGRVNDVANDGRAENSILTCSSEIITAVPNDSLCEYSIQDATIKLGRHWRVEP